MGFPLARTPFFTAKSIASPLLTTLPQELLKTLLMGNGRSSFLKLFSRIFRATPGYPSKKGSRERCLPVFFFFWKWNGKNGRKRKKTEENGKKTRKKQKKTEENWRKLKKTEKTEKTEKIGSDTILATPFAKPRATPGYPSKNPGISRQKAWLPWASKDIPNFLAPTSSRGRPKDIRTKKFGFGFLFLPEISVVKRENRGRKRGHYERGLFTGGISRISKISGFSRISRKWSESPLFSTVWGFSRISRISRISKFSKISRKWTSLKRPLFQKTPFSELETISTSPYLGRIRAPYEFSTEGSFGKVLGGPS